MEKEELEKLSNEYVEKVDSISYSKKNFYGEKALSFIKAYFVNDLTGRDKAVKTSFENLTDKELYSKFCAPNFNEYPLRKIKRLCNEVHNRICKERNVKPVKFQYKIDDQYFMQYCPGLKTIDISQPESVRSDGLMHLFATLQETEHVQQYAIRQKMAESRFTKFELIELLQHILTNCLSFYLGEDNSSVKKFIYYTDMLENRANMFAINYIDNLEKKSLIPNNSNLFTYQYEYYKGHLEAFNESNRILDNCKYGFVTLFNTAKDFYNENQILMSKLEKTIFGFIFDNISIENIVDYYDTFKKELKDNFNTETQSQQLDNNTETNTL